MRRISHVRSGLLVAACMLAFGGPSEVVAETFAGRPVPGTTVLLEYGARYTTPDGAARTHQGLDIEADGGSTVRACADSDVVFAGPVPGAGEAVLAVTLACAGGIRVTLLPLDSLQVRQGARISTGDPVGSLRPAGDASSSQAHLHVGVRRGETYLDPAAFLPTEAAAVPAEAPPVSSAAPAPAILAVVEPPPVPVTAAHPVATAAIPRPAAVSAAPVGRPVSAGTAVGAVRAGAAIPRPVPSPQAGAATVTRFERLRARTTADLPVRGRETAAGAMSSMGRLGKATRRAAGRCAALTWAVLALWPVWRASGERAVGALPVKVRA